MYCHACGDLLLPSVLDLGDIPLVDKYLSNKNESNGVLKSPLSLKQCSKCRTYQIEKVVNPNLLYDQYIYNSSSSPDLNDHFDEYSEYIYQRLRKKEKSKILEIGGNDGLLLRKLNNKGIENLVVTDPAPQVEACRNFSTIYREHFGTTKSEQLLMQEGKFDIIIANNCLAHIPDLKRIFNLINFNLNENGMLIFEVNSLYHQVINDVFDYIYNEHIFYHSVTSLEKLLSFAGLFINEVKVVDTKGGSLRITCSRNYKKSNALEYWKIKEESIGIHNDKPEIFKSLNQYIPFLKDSIYSIIHNTPYEKIYGFGACVTSTILVEVLELGNILSGIIDDNINRQGRFSTGKGIEVYSKDILGRNDLVINLAWRHNEVILKSLSESNINKVICPIPYPKSYDLVNNTI